MVIKIPEKISNAKEIHLGEDFIYIKEEGDWYRINKATNFKRKVKLDQDLTEMMLFSGLKITKIIG